MQNQLTLRCAGSHFNVANLLFVDGQCQFKFGFGQHALRLVGPLGNFQTGAGKQVSEARLFKLLWIVESVEIKMPNGHRGECDGVPSFMRLHNGIGWAFDAALYTQGLQ